MLQSNEKGQQDECRLLPLARQSLIHDVGLLSMNIPLDQFEKRLDAISEFGGVPYGRAHLLFDEEDAHSRACLQYKGFLALSDAFKCFFLETVERINTECRPKLTWPLPEFYVLFAPRLAHSFKSLCGSERLALKGYPYHACTILRNTFDNLVLSSAALQGITTFYLIEGLEVGKLFDPKSAKKIRKETEFDVRRMMTGSKSGLNKVTIDALTKLDEVFDYEVHGGRLSLADNQPWMKGEAPLSVLPTFQERAFGMFMNRYCEIAWMTHRLIPLLQPSEASLEKAWREKWETLDSAFETMVNSLTVQLGKGVGKAVDEFVKSKFSFSASSVFPE